VPKEVTPKNENMILQDMTLAGERQKEAYFPIQTKANVHSFHIA